MSNSSSFIIGFILFFVTYFVTYFVISRTFEKVKQKQREKAVHSIAEGVLRMHGIPTDSDRSHAIDLIKQIANSGGWKWFDLSRNHQVTDISELNSVVFLDFRKKTCQCIILKTPKGYDLDQITSRCWINRDSCLLVPQSKILEVAPHFYDGCNEEDQSQYSILINTSMLGKKNLTGDEVAELFKKGKITKGEMVINGLNAVDESLGYVCLTLVETEAEKVSLMDFYIKNKPDALLKEPNCEFLDSYTEEGEFMEVSISDEDTIAIGFNSKTKEQIVSLAHQHLGRASLVTVQLLKGEVEGSIDGISLSTVDGEIVVNRELTKRIDISECVVVN